MFKYLFPLLLLFPMAQTSAQNLQIPRPSPQATVIQKIGVASIQIDYSRPAARGRTIFGGLVPYDKVWRAGANEATVLTLSHETTIGEKSLKPGKYALFAIPRKEKDWTIIINSEWNQWGAYNHNPEKDILQFDAKTEEISHVELCTFHFPEVSKTSGNLALDWGKTRVVIPIETQTHEQTLGEIAKATNSIQNFWYTYSAAAQYHYYERKEIEPALKYIDVAIALDAPNPAPWMLKSQILAEQGKYEEAIKLAEKAIEVSKEHNFWFELEENEEQIETWAELMKHK